jgi:hypothetical protein
MLREGQSRLRILARGQSAIFALAIFAGVLAGCLNMPESYAPPMQRRALAGPDTSGLKHFIAMNDPAAPDHFLRDVRDLESGTWRWTGQNPTLRFVLPTVEGVKFKAEFSVSGETFATTGPFHITYWVNGKQLDKVRYTAPGPQSFSKPVDPAWLVKDGDNVVKMELEKAYVAKGDGVVLGVTLTRAGFVE